MPANVTADKEKLPGETLMGVLLLYENDAVDPKLTDTPAAPVTESTSLGATISVPASSPLAL